LAVAFRAAMAAWWFAPLLRTQALPTPTNRNRERRLAMASKLLLMGATIS
jgi:hypothetical protein